MFGAYLSWAFFNPPVIPIFLFVEKRFPSQYKLEIVGTNLKYPAVKVVVNGYGTKLFFVKSGFGSQKSAANLYTPWPPMCSWKKGTRTENYPIKVTLLQLPKLMCRLVFGLFFEIVHELHLVSFKFWVCTAAKVYEFQKQVRLPMFSWNLVRKLGGYSWVFF